MSEKIPVTLKEIEEGFDTFIYRVDPYVIKLTLATILGNSLSNRKPIWMMLVAPPSSGKTTVLNSLLDLEIPSPDGERVKPLVNISDLTTNSFASGMVRGDKETSLLKRFQKEGSVMVFKDFTSVLSKNRDEKRIIMGQLREIYDGSYVKRTGNGNDVEWTGKVGAIAGCTESIFQHLESMSVMGDRFMLYQIDQPDRREMLKFKIDQESRGITEETQMPLVRTMTHQYMQYAFAHIADVKLVFPEDVQDHIIDIADFCTKARSGIILDDYDGKIKFVPQTEMPARMFEQMIAIANALAVMNLLEEPDLKPEELLKPEDFQIMYRCAYHSIPIVRRIALVNLARYNKGVETAALATATNYQTPVVKGWLEQINALGVAERIVTSSGSNMWKMSDKYAEIVHLVTGIKRVNESLTDSRERTSFDDTWERDKAASAQAAVAEMLENDTF